MREVHLLPLQEEQDARHGHGPHGECLHRPVHRVAAGFTEKAEDTSETGWSEVMYIAPEKGSLVAKNPVLNELVQLDDDGGLLPQIDCSIIFILIGPILIDLDVQNFIKLNHILQNIIV